MNGSRATGYTLFIVLFLAFLMRGVAVFDVSLPYSFYPDESSNVERSVLFYDGQGGFDLNPRWFNKPALGYYVNFGAFGCRYLVGRYLTGEYASSTEFANAFLNHERTSFYVVGRLLQALFGTIGVYLVFRIGRAYGGPRTGILAAIFLAFCPAHIEFSQVVKNDALASVFVSLAFLSTLRIVEAGRSRDHLLAAAFIGLGWATKYAPIVMLGVLVLAHLMRPRPEGTRVLSLRLCGATLLVFLGAAFVGSPYNFLDATYRNEQLAPLLDHFSGLVFGAGEAQGGRYGLGYLFGYALYMTALPGSFTPIFSAFALFGLGFGLRGRPKGKVVLLLAWVGLVYFMLASANMQRTRPNHLMLIYPALAVLAALGVEWFLGQLQRRFEVPVPRLLALLLVCLLLPVPGFASDSIIQRCRRLFTAPPQLRAMRWVEENIEAGATLANDTEILTLRLTGPRYDWISRRIAFEIEKSERAIATEKARLRDAADFDAQASRRIIAHHEKQLVTWRQQEKRYAYEIPAAAAYEGPRYDAFVLEKPWQTEDSGNLGAFSGYNGIWERFPLPTYDGGWGRLDQLDELPPVERYRRTPDRIAGFPEMLWPLHPLLPGRPADFWVSSEESFRNYDKPSKREEFPEWAAFYDDLRQHYDAVEIPANPSLDRWSLRIFDLRQRRATGTAEIRVLDER